jgi:transposase
LTSTRPRGRHYGTTLIDIETRRPIDLLPDREASSLAAWLAARLGVEVDLRDRAPFFAEGATVGAPQAVQAADRWHLWHNVSQAVERAVAQYRRCLRTLVTAAPDPDREPAPEKDSSGSPWPTGHRFADRTRARHADIHALLEAGHSRRSVQRQLGMTWRTVKQLAEAKAPEKLFTGQWQNRPSVLDDYKPYLDDRWNKGCTNMLTERQGERLPGWIFAIRQENLPSLHTLAAGIDRDRDAVITGLTLPWSSGAVEDHINRIKMIKRQMYGRAGINPPAQAGAACLLSALSVVSATIPR